MKNKFIYAILIVLCFFCGCGTEVFCGTEALIDIQDNDETFNQNTEVSWYNGNEICKENIIVQKPLNREDSLQILKQYDTSFLPKQETCSYWCFKVSGTDKYIPGTVTDYNREKFIYNGIEYNQNIYQLSKEWYCFQMPNGCKQCLIKLGNNFFY